MLFLIFVTVELFACFQITCMLQVSSCSKRKSEVDRRCHFKRTKYWPQAPQMTCKIRSNATASGKFVGALARVFQFPPLKVYRNDFIFCYILFTIGAKHEGKLEYLNVKHLNDFCGDCNICTINSTTGKYRSVAFIYAFEWTHIKISSTHWKLRTTLCNTIKTTSGQQLSFEWSHVGISQTQKLESLYTT